MVTRRRFVEGAAFGVAALTLSTTMARAEEPQLAFPTEPRKRLSVTSYPFRAFINSPGNTARDKSKPGMDLIQFAEAMRERFGITNINPLADHLQSSNESYLEKFRSELEKGGTKIVDLGLGGRAFSSADKDTRTAAVAFGRGGIDIAKAVGSPSVRQHLKNEKGVTPSVEFAAQSLKELADYGASQGVVVNLENDSPGAEDPLFITAVVERVNHPYLRSLPDFGNSIRGHDAAYNKKVVGEMFKHAWNMSHVKDALKDRDSGLFTVDVAELFAVARENKYRGYFSMEYDTAVGDPFEGTQKLVELSLQYMDGKGAKG